jgi:hypothetical protein
MLSRGSYPTGRHGVKSEACAAARDTETQMSQENLELLRDAYARADPLTAYAERFIDVDEERVLVLVRVTATGQGSGTPVEARAAHEFMIRDGRLVRFKAYIDRAMRPSKPPASPTRRRAWASRPANVAGRMVSTNQFRNVVHARCVSDRVTRESAERTHAPA